MQPTVSGTPENKAFAVSFTTTRRGLIYAPTALAALRAATEQGEAAAAEIADAASHVSVEYSLPRGTLVPDLHVLPLTLRDVAARVDSTPKELTAPSARLPLPEPDARVGGLNVWWPETIDAWQEVRDSM